MFKSKRSQRPPQILFQDRFHQVELAISFKRLTCYHCGLQSIYKYRVKQIRRHAEITRGEDEEIRSDHREMWKSIPRFAEIPETLRCKRCRETLSPDVLCLY